MGTDCTDIFYAAHGDPGTILDSIQHLAVGRTVQSRLPGDVSPDEFLLGENVYSLSELQGIPGARCGVRAD